MTVADIMRRKLEEALAPELLNIEDQSDRHIGHAGHRPGIPTHFHVTVVAPAFEGQSRVQRHRMVTAALKDVIGNPVHALALTTLTPQEAAQQRN